MEILTPILLILAGFGMVLVTSPQILLKPKSAYRKYLAEKETGHEISLLESEVTPIKIKSYSGIISILVLLTASGLFCWSSFTESYAIQKTVLETDNSGLLISIFQPTSFSNSVISGLLALGFLYLLIGIDHAKTLRYRCIYFAAILFCSGIVMLLASVQNLLFLFILYELASIGVGVLISFCEEGDGIRKTVKNYWMNQVVSSVLFFWGIILLWGLGKTFDLTKLNQEILSLLNSESAAIWGAQPVYLLIGSLLLLVASIGMKMGLIPFQSGTIFLRKNVSSGSQSVWILVQFSAGMIVFSRLVQFCFTGIPGITQLLLIVVAGATMLIPAILATREQEWSKVYSCMTASYGGFFVLAIASSLNFGSGGSRIEVMTSFFPDGIHSGYYFLFIFLLINVGLHGIQTGIKSDGFQIRYLEDFRGLYHVHPPTAFYLTIILAALAGFPLTAGFWGRFFITGNSLSVSVPENQGALSFPNPVFFVMTLIFLLSTMIMAVLLVQLCGSLFFQSPVKKSQKPSGQFALSATLLVAILLIGIGLFPSTMSRLVEDKRQTGSVEVSTNHANSAIFLNERALER